MKRNLNDSNPKNAHPRRGMHWVCITRSMSLIWTLKVLECTIKKIPKRIRPENMNNPESDVIPLTILLTSTSRKSGRSDFHAIYAITIQHMGGFVQANHTGTRQVTLSITDSISAVVAKTYTNHSKRKKTAGSDSQSTLSKLLT
ncbi:hypothetical protein MTO96_037670 [Rhipicephalus appendiculatus]